MIAMLIDADNVSYRNIKDMTDELARFGNLTIKRIYGIWRFHEVFHEWMERCTLGKCH